MQAAISTLPPAEVLFRPQQGCLLFPESKQCLLRLLGEYKNLNRRPNNSVTVQGNFSGSVEGVYYKELDAVVGGSWQISHVDGSRHLWKFRVKTLLGYGEWKYVGIDVLDALYQNIKFGVKSVYIKMDPGCRSEVGFLFPWCVYRDMCIHMLTMRVANSDPGPGKGFWKNRLADMKATITKSTIEWV